jgi:hypothetical protein
MSNLDEIQWLGILGGGLTIYILMASAVHAGFNYPDGTKIGIFIFWPIILLIEICKSVKSTFLHAFKKAKE